MTEQTKKEAKDPVADPTRITPEQYIKERVQGQIDYFNRKSGEAQRNYKKYKRLEFILAASIPVTVTFSSMAIAKEAVFVEVGNAKVNLDLLFQVVAAVAGVVMAIINKVTDLEDYYKRWKDFRVNSEALEHEKHLFMTRSADYEEGEEDVFSRFVDKVESILSNDVQRWKQKNKQQDEQQQQPQSGDLKMKRN